MNGIEAFLKTSRLPLLVKLWRQICYRLVRDDGVIKCQRNGINFSFLNAQRMGKYIFQRGNWEPRQVAFFFQNAQKRGADVFLDIGANFGYYSLLAAKAGMFSEIHAMEAHPQTYETLRASIAANDFSRVITPHNAAASDMQGEIFIDKFPSRVAAVYKNTRPDTIAISAMPLDSVFDFSGRNIAVKMDVEGHEIAALRGMANLIRRNNVFLQVEAWEKSVDFFYFVMECGLRIHHRIEDDFYLSNDKE